MKFKDKIVSKWSLESKDNYEPIKRQLSFNNPHDTFRKRILFKGIVTSVASIVFICLLVGMSIQVEDKWGSDPLAPGMGLDSVGGEGSGNSQTPDNLGGVTDGNEGSQKPSNPDNELESPVPGAPNGYLSFIEEIKKFNFESSLFEKITYSNKLPSIGTSSTNVDKIMFVNEIVEILNKLEFEEITFDENLNTFNHKLVINEYWCIIHFDENEHVALEYNDEYHIYKTNSENVYNELKEFLR